MSKHTHAQKICKERRVQDIKEGRHRLMKRLKDPKVSRRGKAEKKRE